MIRWPADRQQAKTAGWTLPFLLATCLALPLPGQAEIYKCRLPGGQTEISNTPCGTPAATLGVRPDETVPAASREQAERDVERMRSFVEKREAAQRQEDEADQRRQAELHEAHARQRVYQATGMDDCLAELEQHVLDSRRRGELEAICRAKPKPAAPPPPTVIVPAYGSGPAQGGLSLCIQNVMRLRLAPAEQNRRIDLCQGQYPQVVTPTPLTPASPVYPGVPLSKTPCPRGDKFCVR